MAGGSTAYSPRPILMDGGPPFDTRIEWRAGASLPSRNLSGSGTSRFEARRIPLAGSTLGSERFRQCRPITRCAEGSARYRPPSRYRSSPPRLRLSAAHSAPETASLLSQRPSGDFETEGIVGAACPPGRLRSTWNPRSAVTRTRAISCPWPAGWRPPPDWRGPTDCAFERSVLSGPDLHIGSHFQRTSFGPSFRHRRVRFSPPARHQKPATRPSGSDVPRLEPE